MTIEIIATIAGTIIGVIATGGIYQFAFTIAEETT